jgi:Ran GTPase-activating protein (RanGAP) involved in mRNA processing and transport
MTLLRPLGMLLELVLSGNGLLSKEAGRVLAELLQNTASLRELDLSVGRLQVVIDPGNLDEVPY